MKSAMDFLQRLEFVDSFKDLIRAIQLVAMARLQAVLDRIRKRQRALAVLKRAYTVLYRDPENIGMVLFICGADKTGCGAVNGTIFKVTRKLVTALARIGKRFYLFTLGKRIRVMILALGILQYGRTRAIELLDSEMLTPVLVRTLLPALYNIGWHVRFRMYWCVFTRYIAHGIQTLKCIGMPSLGIWMGYYGIGLLFYVVLQLLTRSIAYVMFFIGFSISILDVLEENRYCVYNARATTMENVYNTLMEQVVVLRIIYNQRRQAGITTSLLEVIAGVVYARI